MRNAIAAMAPHGWKPQEIRNLIPRDWRLIIRGFTESQKTSEPGGNAPSQAEHDDLIRKYG